MASQAVPAPKRAAKRAREDPARGGFRALPHANAKGEQGLREPPRFVFFRKHQFRAGGAEGDEEGAAEYAGRTLFAANIPLDFAPEDVSELFGCFGAVETVIMQRPPETVIPFVSAPSDDPDARHAALGTQCAKVVYESEAALDAALATPVESTVQTYVAGSLPTGMRKWLGEWRARRPDVAKLQLQVERFMEGFDRKERAEREAAAASKATPVVDEEGFTLVTYGSSRKKRPRVFHEEGGPPRESAKEAKKRAQQEQMVLSFYKFQKRDAQQKQLDTLRRRVEEDKRRIARMKERREFNPFA